MSLNTDVHDYEDVEFYAEELETARAKEAENQKNTIRESIIAKKKIKKIVEYVKSMQ